MMIDIGDLSQIGGHCCPTLYVVEMPIPRSPISNVFHSTYNGGDIEVSD